MFKAMEGDRGGGGKERTKRQADHDAPEAPPYLLTPEKSYVQGTSITRTPNKLISQLGSKTIFDTSHGVATS